METKKQPAAIIITDTHLSDKTVDQNLSVFGQAIKLAIELRVRYVIHAGDMLINRVGQSELVVNTLRQIIDLFVEADIYLLAIAGNHDKTSYINETSFLHAFIGSHFKVVHHSEMLVFNQLNIMFLSYFDENLAYQAKFMECHKNFDETKDNVLITHCAVDGVTNNAGIEVKGEVPQSLFNKFKVVFVGHYHNRQAFRNIVYLGASDPRNHGEDSNKGVVVLYDDGSYEFIGLTFRSYVTVDMLSEDLTADVLSKIVAKQGQANVRLRVQGTLSEQMNVALASLNQTGVQVELHKEVMVGDVHQVTSEVQVTSLDLVELYATWAKDRQLSDVEVGLSLLEEVL